MKMKTYGIFMYEECKEKEVIDLFVKMFEEGLETLITESPENKAEAIRYKSKQGTLQNEVKETHLTVAMRRFNKELRMYLNSFDYYSDGDTYEEERLLRVKAKYQKYKNLFGLNDCGLEIPEKMVRRLWRNYLHKDGSDYLDFSEILSKIRMIIAIDNYIERVSTIIYNTGGKIKGYPSTAKDIEKMRFLMSVDVAVAIVALEDYYQEGFECKFFLNFFSECFSDEIIKEFALRLKLTKQGKKRCKAIIDIILPEKLQPAEFKAIMKR